MQQSTCEEILREMADPIREGDHIEWRCKICGHLMYDYTHCQSLTTMILHYKYSKQEIDHQFPLCAIEGARGISLDLQSRLLS